MSAQTTSECVSAYDVLVMDRARIVCLSLGEICLNQERLGASDKDEVNDQEVMAELGIDSKKWVETELREQGQERQSALKEQLNEHLDNIQEHLNQHVAEVNKHVDRHLGLIKEQDGNSRQTQ